ncbi:MAG: hypothetical protein ACI351_01350 [Candidatus Avelusimicrobium sp.]|uniref:hypothetical protein n=1 Tax=Candidatus Avelusimicrobium sp. TaxID=3048833 RepID=UPI003F0BFDCA
MKKTLACLTLLITAPFLQAQEMSADALTTEEETAVAAILAKQARQDEPPGKETTTAEKITLSEETKQQALDENNQDATAEPDETASEEKEEEDPKPQKCLTVAFVDIDVAFNEHPRTVAVKEQIRLKIVSKEDEVRGAKQLIEVLAQENAMLSAQIRELKPFYERIVVEPQPLQPKIEESADALLLGNVLNRLTFSGAEILSTSPLNTPARLEDLQARIASNKKIIAERGLFIDNYRYTTREEILQLEKKEVNEILKDIYTEIKSFAKKRNIGAVVRKDEILYGEKPVNVTKDFVSRLKKSKKYRKRGK